jgi:hypothetical protein
MSFLLSLTSSTADQAGKALAEYRTYLESVRRDLPPSAHEFASAPWHYDFADHRCPHDSWLETLTISEPSSGTRKEKRQCQIRVHLLGAFHDGYIDLSYLNVRSYSFSGASVLPDTAHGEWLIDEVRLSQRKLVEHEVLFSSGSHWLIESEDIRSRWVQA